ncbi:PIN domain-like protein [Suillus subluteus]|nr:PIN domain-like protein [Suillus subluteus]
MGIPQVWTYLKPSARTKSLTALALEGRYAGCPPFRPFIIGVDVSIWFKQCQQVMCGQAHARSGQNPALCTFLFWTARLKHFLVQLVFTYDGPDRPALKRGKNVATTKDHWMTKPTQRILDAFNIQWFMARGEAEAKLAAMNSAGTIDAVMTDDSDVFAFGCHCFFPMVSVYEAAMPREDYALVSLLCGGDYDMTGLPGCGPATAFGLARCGMGNSLLAAESGCKFAGPHHQAWRNDVQQHLRYDPTSEILSFNTWSAYLHPAIHEPLVSICEPGVPDAGKIVAVVVPLLGWEDAGRLLDTFHGKVWPGVVTSELLQDLSTWAVKAFPHVGAQGHLQCLEWSESLPLSTDTVGESSKTPAKSREKEHSSECEVVAGPSLLDTIDLTNNSEGDDEWVIDLTRDYFGCSSGSKSRGKSKAQPMDIIDLT